MKKILALLMLQASLFSMAHPADSLLNVEPLTVMMKPIIAASGDKHDYLSQARYTWPDPTKPDGLPYIHRDGETNPEIYRLDRQRLGRTCSRVVALAEAWNETGDERYAAQAARLTRAWFLDEDTRMNPNLRYAQVVPGLNNGEGRCYGIIDTYSMVPLVDALTRLEHSGSWTAKDAKEMKQWVADLCDWMETSPQGIEEAGIANNHSIAYDAQLMAFRIYAGQPEKAKAIAEKFNDRRLAVQIAADGSQPHELGRTLSYHYSQYNLAHIVDVAEMSGRLGVDIDLEPIERAFNFLLPYIGCPRSEWPYKQISDWTATQKLLLDDYRRFALLKAARQLNYAVECAEMASKQPYNVEGNKVAPRTLDADGNLVMVHPHDWCSGFFAGNLWLMYRLTGEKAWLDKADRWTWPIEMASRHRGTHDLGFMIYDSFGAGYDLTGDTRYRDVVLEASRTLVTRYDPGVGCIRSWDHNAEQWQYPVIIDNMMNLEMLFRATQLTGDSTYYYIAVKHADTTLANHFRSDNSCYHVVDYNPLNGNVNTRCTAQGYGDESVWSRGQAWALYGYTMCYRFTHDERYLDHARNVAEFIFSQPLPEDGVPYWDMLAPGDDNRARDASAAAITSSALYELAELTGVTAWRDTADKLLTSLTRFYTAREGTSGGFQLLHSTGHHPAGSEIDVPLVYADYYYLESLARAMRR